MLRRLPVFLTKPIDANSRVHQDDVVVVKRSLERLGYYQRPEWGFTGLQTINCLTALEISNVTIGFTQTAS